MKYHIIVSIAFSFLFFFPLHAHADWVMLNNGDRISGVIQQETTSDVVITNDSLGEITLPKAKIYSVHKGTAPRRTAREMRTGQSNSMAPGAVAENIEKTKVTPAVTEVTETVKTKKPKQKGYKWTGRVSAGGNVQDGNSRSKSVTADADIKARDEKNRFSFGGEANWAEDNGEKTDNDQQIYANYDRFITEKWFIGGRQSFEKDEFEELDLRSQTGLFAGYQFYEQDDLNLQVKAGPDYIYEEFENGQSESDLALSWALDYDQKFKDGALQLFHKHEISTPFAETDAFLLESETGARVPIGKRLDASAQIDFDWDNDPTDGVREDDTTYAVKLGYGW